jgi:hypothetical protein
MKRFKSLEKTRTKNQNESKPEPKPFAICVIDYLRFCNLTDKPKIQPFLGHLHKVGYENVFLYSKELEMYLLRNEITYDIEYEEKIF